MKGWNSERYFAFGFRIYFATLILGGAPTALDPSLLAADTVPPPSQRLGSVHNYYLYNGGKPILGLVVTVELTQDVVCDDKGFHIQLNANSPNQSNIHTHWQQYVMGFHPQGPRNPKPYVGCSIEYFAKPYGFNTARHADIERIYDVHFQGVDQVRGLVAKWKSLRGKIDEHRYAEVLEKLQDQLKWAIIWCDAINCYFHELSGIAEEKGRTITGPEKKGKNPSGKKGSK